MVDFNLNGVVCSPPLDLGNGRTYMPTALCSNTRTLMGGIQATGICHNTDNIDLTAIYNLAHLATRHAIAVAQCEKVTFVELGTWCGESAIATACGVAEAARELMVRGFKLMCTIVVVDTFGGTLSDLNAATVRHFQGSIQDYCRDNLLPLPWMLFDGVKFEVEIIQGDSVATAAQFAAREPIDWLFIDAGHTDQECSADFQAWFPYVRPGAFIVGHDYSEHFPGVIQAADRNCQQLCGCVPAVVTDSSVFFARKPSSA